MHPFNCGAQSFSGAIRPLLYICILGLITFSGHLLLQSPRVHHLLPTTLHDIITPPTKPLNQSELFQKLSAPTDRESHPIDHLVSDAKRKQEDILKTRTYDTASAAKAYRERRKRHPPPGFDAWVEYASQHDAVVIEKYFDRIYHDLGPFWAVDSKVVAESAANWDHVVQVRNGTAFPIGDTTGRVAWLALWTNLVAECAKHLPDVDMPINYMDESRLLVPWVEIDKLMKTARMHQKVTPVKDTVQTFQRGGVNRSTSPAETEPVKHRPVWIKNLETPVWSHVQAACQPDTPAASTLPLTNLEGIPDFSPMDMPYAEKGYVKNATASTDACLQPHLRGLHGTFIEPISISTSTQLFPIFSGSKLPFNNDIIIPGAMYLTDDPFYSGGASYGPNWEFKDTRVIWRGVASGGRHKQENWRHFQRLRLVEMLNGTTVFGVQNKSATPQTFKMPPISKYESALKEPTKMGDWLTKNSDAGFVDLLCFPKDDCSYLAQSFHEVQSKPMVEQYGSKFMVDVDGNSFSARYRALILSTSVPIKSTIYAEWHDDRLQPWLHYIPMDNSYQDLYGILDYFTRDTTGDAAAEYIAESGKAWGEATLRREDMLLYVWRLLLEFARVCDSNREKLGYIADLTDKKGA